MLPAPYIPFCTRDIEVSTDLDNLCCIAVLALATLLIVATDADAIWYSEVLEKGLLLQRPLPLWPAAPPCAGL